MRTARDLTEGKNAEVENGKLTLNGGESYADGAIDKISTGTSLSFDIELTEPACPAISSLRPMRRTARWIFA